MITSTTIDLLTVEIQAKSPSIGLQLQRMVKSFASSIKSDPDSTLPSHHRELLHPTQLGLQKVEYQIRALDRAGNPAGFKAKVFEKTVYDPRLISDSDMLRLGREAADNALARGALEREWTGTASNGMQFRGYLDSSGAVRSFFREF